MGSTVISAMRYRDPHKMIDWQCDTFGFTRKAVHDDGNGGVAHAELTLGDGMIMLGSARDDDFAKVQKPAVANHLVTQSAYIVVPDADPSMPGPRPTAPSSFSRFPTRTMEGATSPAAILRAKSGALALIIRGLIDGRRSGSILL